MSKITSKPNTWPLYESPQKDDNEEKYGHITNQCICCFKPMREGESKHVHMNTDWVAVRVDIDEADVKRLTGAESQGCFPIGNSCAKKMPKAYIIDKL